MSEKPQEFSKYVESNVEVEALKNVIKQMPVQLKFKNGLKEHLNKKGLFEKKICDSLMLGIAYAEYVNENVNPESTDDMKDFHISKAILSNSEILPIIEMR